MSWLLSRSPEGLYTTEANLMHPVSCTLMCAKHFVTFLYIDNSHVYLSADKLSHFM